jgi:hypothetical protein
MSDSHLVVAEWTADEIGCQFFTCDFDAESLRDELLAFFNRITERFIKQDEFDYDSEWETDFEWRMSNPDIPRHLRALLAETADALLGHEPPFIDEHDSVLRAAVIGLLAGIKGVRSGSETIDGWTNGMDTSGSSTVVTAKNPTSSIKEAKTRLREWKKTLRQFARMSHKRVMQKAEKP